MIGLDLRRQATKTGGFFQEVDLDAGQNGEWLVAKFARGIFIWQELTTRLAAAPEFRSPQISSL